MTDSRRLVVWHRWVVPARDDPDDAAAAVAWARAIAARAHAAGATVLATAGSSVAAMFDESEMTDAIDFALELLDEADRTERAGGTVQMTIGAALGTVEPAGDTPPTTVPGPTHRGGAIERAHILATRARPGELVLDPAAHEAASSKFLFSRSVPGAGTLRGQSVDRKYPRREGCQLAIQHLAVATVPESGAESYAKLAQIAGATGSHRVVLRGAIGAGGRVWIDALAREICPPLLLVLAGVPGGLEPLGSLRYALLRAFGSTAELLAAHDIAPSSTRPSERALGALADGRGVAQRDAVSALRIVLERAHAAGGRPWIAFTAAGGIDPASVEVVAEASAMRGSESLVLLRLQREVRAPAALLRAGKIDEIALAPLDATDSNEVAQAIVGPGTAGDVVRKVAMLGGETELGILEAARALVASGSLVHDGGRFTWRVRRRGIQQAAPLESLIGERISFLSETTYRALEAICVAPIGAPYEVIAAVTSADGLSHDALAASMDRLRSEALIHGTQSAGTSQWLLRAVVQKLMPPSRLADLNGLVARALEADLVGASAIFARATLGHYLGEAGRVSDAASALLEAGRAAASAGFVRSAVRLAAGAVRYHPTDDTRAAAARLTQAANESAFSGTLAAGTEAQGAGPVSPLDRALARIADSTPPSETNDTEEIEIPVEVVASDFASMTIPDDATTLRPLPPSNGGSRPAARAVEAIRARDLDALERCIEMAVGAGRHPAAAERLRAVAYLARGDVQSAKRTLDRAGALGDDDKKGTARALLTRSLVLLRTRDATRAVRAALAALAAARTAHDAHGEVAALKTLAVCYRALDREPDAARLDRAAAIKE